MTPGDWIGAVNGFRKTVPWWVRIGVKIVLARLPVPYEAAADIRAWEHEPAGTGTGYVS